MTHISLRNAAVEDVAPVFSIMKEVSGGMKDHSLYVTGDEQYIGEHISEKGFTILAVCDEKTVGFLIVDLPGESPDNPGRLAGLPEKELSWAGIMDSCAVLEPYRGHGIQRMLLMEAEIQLKRRTFRYALATVSPDNPYSLENCAKLGYQIAATKKMYGGLLRHILLKAL